MPPVEKLNAVRADLLNLLKLWNAPPADQAAIQAREAASFINSILIRGSRPISAKDMEDVRGRLARIAWPERFKERGEKLMELLFDN